MTFSDIPISILYFFLIFSLFIFPSPKLERTPSHFPYQITWFYCSPHDCFHTITPEMVLFFYFTSFWSYVRLCPVSSDSLELGASDDREHRALDFLGLG